MGQLLDIFDAATGTPKQASSGAFPRISPQEQAQRDAEAQAIVSRETMPNGGGAPATSTVIPGATERYQAAMSGQPQKGGLLDIFDQAISSSNYGRGGGSSASEQIPGHIPQPQPRQESITNKLLGAPEAALTFGTGLLAAPAAAIGSVGGAIQSVLSGQGTQYNVPQRFREILQGLTYQPRTESGQEALGAANEALAASKLQGLGPTEATTIGGMMAARTAPAALKSAATERPANVVPIRPQQASVGAAGADVATQARTIAADASPEIRAAVEATIQRMEKKGGTLNLEALDRQVKANQLPDPIHLLPGQSTRDPVKISNEMNRRAKDVEFAKTFNEQNQKLINNTRLIRDEAAPDVFVNTKPEVGNLVIDAYRAKDAALEAGINAKYKALRDANGGQFPMDAKTFVDTADAALHKGLLYDHVPPAVRATMDRLKAQGSVVGGGMTFENFEAMRTQLARIMRSPNADGNTKAAAGVVRQALEELPMPYGMEKLKPLADSARQAARERFALIEADPAYSSIVKGNASADKFIQQRVVGADTKSVQTMMKNLPSDEARQAVRAGVMDYLSDAAKIKGGNFSQSGYNRALEQLRPKLSFVFDQKTIRQLENLGATAMNTQLQPRGSFVNNSNTLVAAMGSKAADAAEGLVNFKSGGIPIGSWARGKIEKGRATRELREMMQPGAGIYEK